LVGVQTQDNSVGMSNLYGMPENRLPANRQHDSNNYKVTPLKHIMFFVYLLVVLLGIVESQVVITNGKLCTATQGFTTPTQIDGLTSPFVNDFTWIDSLCVEHPEQIIYDSGWIALPTDKFSLYFSSLRIVNARVKRQLFANSLQDMVNITISSLFELQVTGTVCGQTISNTNLVYKMQKELKNTPTLATQDIPQRWDGTLVTTGSDPIHIEDKNIFDGILPCLILNPQPTAASSLAQMVTNLTTVLGLRDGPFDSVPSGFFSSARGVLMALHDGNNDATTLKGQLVLKSGALSEYGESVQIQSKVRTLGYNNAAFDSVRSLVGESVKNFCESLEIVQDSIMATLTTNLFVGETNIYYRGTSASTRALFRCSDKGFVGISLFATTGYPTSEIIWPTTTFAQDMKASIGMVKGVRPKWSGLLYGTISYNGTLYSATRNDIFSSTLSGKFLAVQPTFDTSVLTSFFTTIKNNVNTGIASLDQLSSSIFAIEKIDEIVLEYRKRSMTPSFVDFLHWYISKYPSMKLELDELGNSATLSVTIFSNENTIKIPSDSAIIAINAAIDNLATKVQKSTPHERITSTSQVKKLTFSAWLKGLFSINNLLDLTHLSVQAIQQPVADASVRIHAQFQQQSLFPCVDADYNYILKRVNIKACLYESGQTTRVALDSSQNLIYDRQIPATSLASEMRSIQVTLKDKINWMTRNINPLGKFAEVVPGVTWLNQLETMANMLDRTSTTSAIEMSAMIEESLHDLSTVDESKLVITAMVTPSISSVELDITVHGLKNVIVSDHSYWAMLTTSRISVLMPITTRIHCTLRIGEPSTVEVASLTGYSVAQNWIVPVRYGMIRGYAHKGYLSIDIKLPEYSSFRLYANTTLEKGRSISIDLASGNLIDDKYRPVSTITDDNKFTVLPSEVLAKLKDYITMLSQQMPLAFSIPPLNHNIAEMLHWTAAIDGPLFWLSTVQSNQDAPLSSLYMCTQESSLPEFNVTLNNILVKCPMASLATQSLETIAVSINEYFVGCHLSNMIRAGVSSSDKTNPSCGVIGIYSVVPGAVWNLVISGLKQRGRIGGVYNGASIPSFNSWDDLSLLLYLIFGSKYTKPIHTVVPVEVARIPKDLQKVFPSQMEAVFIDIDITAAFSNSSSEFKILPKLQLDDGSVKFDINSPGSGRVELIASLSGQFGAVFDITGVNNITITSNLNGIGSTLDQLIIAPANTFSMYCEIERRTVNSSASIKQLFPIVIPSGINFKDAFLDYLPTQIDPNIRKLFSITVDKGEAIFNTTDEIHVTLTRVEVEPGVFLLPIAIGIQRSLIPGWGKAVPENTNPELAMLYQAPSRTEYLTQNTQISINHRFNAITAGPSGTIGILNLNTHSLLGEGNTNIILKQVAKYDSTVKLVSSMLDTDHLFDTFALQLGVKSTSTFSQAVVQIAREGVPPLDELILLIDKVWDIHAQETLAKVIREMNRLTALYKSGSKAVKDVYEGLAKLDSSSFCSFFTGIIDISKEVEGNSVVAKYLPFVSKSLGWLVKNRIGDPYTASHDQLCVKMTNYTLSRVCDALNATWGAQVCHNPIVSQNGFNVDLQMESHHITMQDHFHLNAAHMLEDVSLPVAVGTTDSLNLHTVVNFLLKLRVSWQGGRLNLAIESGSWVELGAWVDARGSFKAYMGPLSLTLADGSIKLGSPATVKAVYLNSPQGKSIDISLKGDASFNVRINVFDLSICKLQITIKSLPEFLHGKSATIDQSTCEEGSFSKAIKKAIFEHSLLKYFQDAKLFLFHWKTGINSVLGRLFGNGEQSLLRRVIVPLVDRYIQLKIEQEISDLVGPALTNKLVDGTTSFVNNILLNHTVVANQTFIDTLVLEAFTQLLCDNLHPTPCPTVPNYNATEYNWTMPITRTIQRTLTDIKFELGNANFAELEAKLGFLFVMNYSFVFTLSYNREHGIRFYFDHTPVFRASVALIIDPDSHFSGVLGFMGADIKTKPNSGLHAAIQIDYTEAKGWVSSFTADAQLSAIAEIGFSGFIAEKIVHEHSLEALPHFKADMEVTWAKFDIHNPFQPPTFIIGNSTFCLGTVIAKLTWSIRQKAGGLLDRLEPLLGAGGLLQKEVPAAEFIFGKKMNVAEMSLFLAKYYCNGHCKIDKVVEILNKFLELYELLRKLNELKDLLKDENGCGALSKIGSFIADFRNPSNFKRIGPIPDAKLDFPSKTITPQTQEKIRTTWAVIQDRGCSISIPILEDREQLPKVVVMLILGQDVDLIRLTLPRMTMIYGVHFSIPIYPWPYVELFVDITAGLIINCPTLVYNTKGIREAITTKQMSNLYRGFGFITKNDDGSEIWLLTGFIRVDGGAYVSVFIFDGSAYVFLQLQGDVSIFSVNQGRIVTFDELFWLLKNHDVWNVLTYRLTLFGGFGFNIRACIPYGFGSKCWTVVSKEWSGVIFQRYFNPTAIEKAALPTGQINLNLVQGGGKMMIYDTPSGTVGSHVSSNPSEPPLSGPMAGTPTVTSIGNPGAGPFTVSVIGTKGLFISPAYASATTEIETGAYRDSSSFAINRNSIVPNSGGQGVCFQELVCSEIRLIKPNFGTNYSFDGVPCPAFVEAVTLSSITFTSVSQHYSNRPVTIKGPAAITCLSPCIDYVIANNFIHGDKGVLIISMQDPSIIPSMVVNTHPQFNSNVQVLSVSDNTDVTVSSGTGDDNFDVPDLFQILGSLEMNGGQGIDIASFSMNTPPEGLYGVVSASTISIRAGPNGRAHVAKWQSIQHRNININGRQNTITQMYYLPMDDGDSIHVIANGVSDSIMYHNITGCPLKGIARYQLKGSGEHFVSIGQAETISEFRCSIYVEGGEDPTQIATVVLYARNEKRPLRYAVEGERITIFDPENTKYYFNLIPTSIERIIIQMSEHEFTELIFNIGPTASITEYHMQYPDRLPLSMNRPRSTICSTTMTLLMSGMVGDVTIGPNENHCDFKSFTSFIDANPLAKITGMVAISGVANGNLIVPVILNSRKDGDQYFSMNASCLVPLNQDKLVPKLFSEPSPWMCQRLREKGFSSCQACHVLYKPHTSTVSVTSGAGNDYFEAVGITTTGLTINMNDGHDTVIFATTSTPATINLGAGRDNIELICPITTTMLSLGPDPDIDIVSLHAGDFAAAVSDDLKVAPVGPQNIDRLYIQQHYKNDILNIHHSFPASSIMQADITSTAYDDIIWYNFTQTSSELRVELLSNRTFGVGLLGKDSTIVFYIDHVAINWKVLILLPDYSVPCMIYVDGSVDSGSLVYVKVPEEPKGMAYEMLLHTMAPRGYGSLEIGALRMSSLASSHLHVKVLSPVYATIYGIPVNADCILDLAAGSTADIRPGALQNNILIINATVDISSTSLDGSVSVFTAGNHATTRVIDSFASIVTYFDGCIKRAKLPPYPSPWFLQQLNEFNIPQKALKGCSLYTNHTKELILSAPLVNATNVNYQEFTATLNAEADIFIADAIKWRKIDMINNTMVVHDRFTLVQPSGYRAWINVPFHTGSLITLSYDPRTVASYKEFNCHNDTHSSMILWNATGTNIGKICSRIPSITVEDVIKDIAFDISLRTNLTQERHLSFYVNLTYFKNDMVNTRIVWNKTRMSQHVYINDQWNTFFLDDSLIEMTVKPTITVSRYAKMNVTLPPTRSVMFMHSTLVFDIHNHKITPNRDLGLQCLLPMDHCIEQYWIDVQFDGNEPCLSAYEKMTCQAMSIAFLQLPQHPLMCTLYQDHTLLSSHSGDISGGSTSWEAIIIFVFYLVANLVNAGLFALFGFIIDIGASNVLFTGLLPRIADPSAWTVAGRFIVMASKNSAINMLNGEYCTERALTANHLATNFTIIACFIVCIVPTIAVVIYRLRYEQTVGDEQKHQPIVKAYKITFATLRLLSFSTILLILPVILTHSIDATIINGWVIASLITIPFMLVTFIFCAWHISPLYPERNTSRKNIHFAVAVAYVCCIVLQCVIGHVNLNVHGAWLAAAQGIISLLLHMLRVLWIIVQVRKHTLYMDARLNIALIIGIVVSWAVVLIPGITFYFVTLFPHHTSSIYRGDDVGPTVTWYMWVGFCTLAQICYMIIAYVLHWKATVDNNGTSINTLYESL
jgi:hypothetical protein